MATTSYLPPRRVRVLHNVNTDVGDVGPGVETLPGDIAERLLEAGLATDEPEPGAPRRPREHRMVKGVEHGAILTRA